MYDHDLFAFGFRSGSDDIRTAAAAADAANARSKARVASREVRELRRELDHLRLVTLALWEIVRDEHGLSEDWVRTKIEEIDLRDGKLDGRIGRTPVDCPDCGRRNNSRRSACLYCGTDLPDTSIV